MKCVYEKVGDPRIMGWLGLAWLLTSKEIPESWSH